MDESRNNMREEFESWLAPSWSRDTYLEDEGEVEYVDDWVQGAWVGWRASRAAIDIELPEADLVYSSATDSYGIEGCMMLPESLVERVLQDAGIKVKGA